MNSHRHSPVFLIPGQGSQDVGMGRDFYKNFPHATALFDLADNLTGQSITTITFRGPFRKLSRTDILQPAITCVNLAGIRFMENAGIHPGAVAGHSLGEIAALAAAGVCSPETALELSVIRGRLMHRAAREQPGGMAAMIGLDRRTAESLAAEYGNRLTIANYNAPDQMVVSGDRETLRKLKTPVAGAGGRLVILDVSGAWHSPAMEAARDEWAATIHATELAHPAVPLYLNVTGRPARNAEDIRNALVRQLTEPVRWMDIIQRMITAGATRFIEPGPGHVLRNLLRRIHPDPSAYEIYSPVSLRDTRKLLARSELIG